MSTAPKKDKYPCTAILRDTMTATGYGKVEMSKYLGVPPATLGNWLAERREMPYVAERLMVVLGTIRALAPDLHVHFSPSPPKPDRRTREFRDPSLYKTRKKVREDRIEAL